MEVFYDDPRLGDTCRNDKDRRRQWGFDNAKRLAQRLTALSAAETLDDLRYMTGRCHELKHDRNGHLAMDLAGGMRLVFRPLEWVEHTVGGLDWKAVTAVVIVAVEDYH
ncbi:hypothetical protein GCM10009677_08100 [Sphaerisporangium rubeum]|uniref:Proteic killer suppression protein n=1 Tax=Sphaerisporangium rubeum TaxID=321317 RepID=A0A7X0IHR7_9ACTN|nr:type II toxin-antitoxin system RelE/ParE family toxin [Sphaerisporangium rubeum]MBB6475470.1 proteic killer suppression protein [Sphaerisporangium rubeum]